MNGLSLLEMCSEERHIVVLFVFIFVIVLTYWCLLLRTSPILLPAVKVYDVVSFLLLLNR